MKANLNQCLTRRNNDSCLRLILFRFRKPVCKIALFFYQTEKTATSFFLIWDTLSILLNPDKRHNFRKMPSNIKIVQNVNKVSLKFNKVGPLVYSSCVRCQI